MRALAHCLISWGTTLLTLLRTEPVCKHRGGRSERFQARRRKFRPCHSNARKNTIAHGIKSNLAQDLRSQPDQDFNLNECPNEAGEHMEAAMEEGNNQGEHKLANGTEDSPTNKKRTESKEGGESSSNLSNLINHLADNASKMSMLIIDNNNNVEDKWRCVNAMLEHLNTKMNELTKNTHENRNLSSNLLEKHGSIISALGKLEDKMLKSDEYGGIIEITNDTAHDIGNNLEEVHKRIKSISMSVNNIGRHVHHMVCHKETTADKEMVAMSDKETASNNDNSDVEAEADPLYLPLFLSFT